MNDKIMQALAAPFPREVEKTLVKSGVSLTYIPVEVAFQYNNGYAENLHSYVNNINTIEGGTHVAGFRRALTRTLKSYADKSGLLKNVKIEIAGDDFRESYEFEIKPTLESARLFIEHLNQTKEKVNE